jgi:hypothetical protein
MAATLTIILKQSNFSLQHYGGTLQLSHTSDWEPNNGLVSVESDMEMYSALLWNL